MDTTIDMAELRRELQQLLSVERDLITEAENAIASGGYRRLRDVADKLVQMADRQAELRASLIAAQARDHAKQAQSSPQSASDVAASTWRLLR